MQYRSYLVSIAARAKTLRGVDLVLRYNPTVRRRVFRLIEAFERADEAERQRMTDALTDRVLESARRTRYGRHCHTSYGDWPVLGKAELRDAPEKFATSGMLRIPAATGGTSGLPIKLWRSPSCVAAEQAFLDHMIRRHGVTWANVRIACMRGDAIKRTLDILPPFGLETHGGRRLVLSGPHLTPHTLPWFLNSLETFRPEILWIWPSMAANLLRLLHQSGRRFQVPVVLSSSERLEPELRDAMVRQWGATVFDYYGQAERACFAVSTKVDEYWFNPAYGRVDLQTSESDEIAGDRRHVRIIATGFWNETMPLVRYDTGDCAIVPAAITDSELRAIALGLKPFLGIAGRSDEFLVAPDGSRVCGLNQLPREVDNLLQLQIVQSTGGAVTIRALVRPTFGSADRAKLEANARAKMPSGMPFRIQIVDRLETSPQGKTPFIIRGGCSAPTPPVNFLEAAD